MKILRLTKRNWFWRTLTGYTVTFINVNGQYTVIHRPFQAPEMINGNPRSQGMRGVNYNVVIFDEFIRMRPSDIEKIRALAKPKISDLKSGKATHE